MGLGVWRCEAFFFFSFPPKGAQMHQCGSRIKKDHESAERINEASITSRHSNGSSRGPGNSTEDFPARPWRPHRSFGDKIRKYVKIGKANQFITLGRGVLFWHVSLIRKVPLAAGQFNLQLPLRLRRVCLLTQATPLFIFRALAYSVPMYIICNENHTQIGR